MIATQQGINYRSKIVKFVRQFIAANGYSPTISEICDDVGLSRCNVFHHLTKLRDSGRVSWIRNKDRTLRLTDN